MNTARKLARQAVRPYGHWKGKMEETLICRNCGCVAPEGAQVGDNCFNCRAFLADEEPDALPKCTDAGVGGV